MIYLIIFLILTIVGTIYKYWTRADLQHLEIHKKSSILIATSFRDLRKDHEYSKDDFFCYNITYNLFGNVSILRYTEHHPKLETLSILNKASGALLNMLEMRVNGVPFHIVVYLHKKKVYQKIEGDLLDIEIDLIKSSKEFKLNEFTIHSLNNYSKIYSIFNRRDRYRLTTEIYSLIRKLWEVKYTDGGSVTLKDIHDEIKKTNRRKIVETILKKK